MSSEMDGVHEGGGITLTPGSVYCKQPLKYFVARAVRIAFPWGGRPERMWVEVTGVAGHRLVGRLMNEPIRANQVARGDRVEVDPAQIECDWASRAEWVASWEKDWERKGRPPAVAGTREDLRSQARSAYDEWFRYLHTVYDRNSDRPAPEGRRPGKPRRPRPRPATRAT